MWKIWGPFKQRALPSVTNSRMLNRYLLCYQWSFLLLKFGNSIAQGRGKGRNTKRAEWRKLYHLQIAAFCGWHRIQQNAEQWCCFRNEVALHPLRIQVWNLRFWRGWSCFGNIWEAENFTSTICSRKQMGNWRLKKGTAHPTYTCLDAIALPNG